jgi:hypothetical protein
MIVTEIIEHEIPEEDWNRIKNQLNKGNFPPVMRFCSLKGIPYEAVCRAVHKDGEEIGPSFATLPTRKKAPGKTPKKRSGKKALPKKAPGKGKRKSVSSK